MAATTTSSDVIPKRRRMTRNLLLIWIKTDIDQSEEDYQNTVTYLKDIAHDVKHFSDRDECVNFIIDNNNMKVSLIVSNTLGEQIIPLIHDLPQLDDIYIFPSTHTEHWTKQWMKVKGTHTEIKSIGESFQQGVKQYNRDSIAISFAEADKNDSTQNLNQLEPTFMYTQIFKEILLEMDDNQHSIKDMVLFWREYYSGNISKLKDIDEFERDYSSQSSISWYTREAFIYEMLNRALRLMEGDTIIKMGIFVRHLHRQIEEMHQQQMHDHYRQPFTVYRGQGVSTCDFQKLLKSKDRLMSFNNFLSTSMNRNIAHTFAESSSAKAETTGVLFKITIDTSVSSTPFASIGERSCFQEEEEILFSMHTVFRIKDITKLYNTSSLYQVDLTLTADDDQDLRIVTNHIRNEVAGETGWKRLGALLIKLKQLDKATELYSILLDHTSEDAEKALYYNNLGLIKFDQGDSEKAIEYYKKSLEIFEKTLRANDPSLGTSYNNIGMVYTEMGEYSIALSFYEKSFKVQQKTLSEDHPDLATSYNNIGSVYDNMGEYSKALSFYKKSLEIREKNLPTNHPDFAKSFNNIGMMYDKMGEYSIALSFFARSHEIQQKTLPEDHPDLASSYNNIGMVHENTEKYSKALSFYKNSLEIRKKALPANHPDFAKSYNNIGTVYHKMGWYWNALLFFARSLKIRERTLPENHPDFAKSYNNIGMVYENMKKYSIALSFFEKSLGIQQKTLPADHPDLASSYNNIGRVYDNMGQYSKALSFYAKTQEIFGKKLPANHPSLATSYNNIGMAYMNMGEYLIALWFSQRALNIFQISLPPNHPNIKGLQGNIERLKKISEFIFNE